jgi:hypothetical protein
MNQFGGRHHTTVLYSINKIERMRQLDEELNGTITRLMVALQQSKVAGRYSPTYPQSRRGGMG